MVRQNILLFMFTFRVWKVRVPHMERLRSSCGKFVFLVWNVYVPYVERLKYKREVCALTRENTHFL